MAESSDLEIELYDDTIPEFAPRRTLKQSADKWRKVICNSKGRWRRAITDTED